MFLHVVQIHVIPYSTPSTESLYGWLRNTKQEDEEYLMRLCCFHLPDDHLVLL